MNILALKKPDTSMFATVLQQICVFLVTYQMKQSVCIIGAVMYENLYVFKHFRIIVRRDAHTARGTWELRPAEGVLGSQLSHTHPILNCHLFPCLPGAPCLIHVPVVWAHHTAP